ncbi:hypothetical protein HK101_004492 [Irineochytrium annulatum]|nr:hypothetical protein HK101_004492 [Irineochytrium annulatum]
MTRGDDEDKDDHEPLDTLRRRMSLSLLDEQHEREFGARGTVRRRSSSVRRGREEKPRRGRDEDGFEADAECGDWNDGGRVRGRSRDRRSRTSANSRRSNGPVTSCDELMGSIDLARHAHVARRSPASSLARLSGSRSRERERVTSVERRDRVQGLLGQVLETARTFKEANVAVKVDGEPAAEYPAGAAGTATVPIERGMSKDATGEGKEKKASGWSKMVRRIRSASQNRKVKSDEMAPPAPPVPTRENESKRGGLGNFRM